MHATLTIKDNNGNNENLLNQWLSINVKLPDLKHLLQITNNLIQQCINAYHTDVLNSTMLDSEKGSQIIFNNGTGEIVINFDDVDNSRM